jgi:hypothetical protein
MAKESFCCCCCCWHGVVQQLRLHVVCLWHFLVASSTLGLILLPCLSTVCASGTSSSACSGPAAALCLNANLLLYVRKLRRLTASQDPVPAAAAAAAAASASVSECMDQRSAAPRIF